MIKINKIGFSNMFSYGEGEVFSVSDPVTQLVGPNGYGKSSLPAILEELLYNKNSRGIKKADISNRYVDSTGYKGYVEFTVDSDNYVLNKTVASTAKVVLTKNGIDVSGHTTTQTYKDIEGILGMDFSTFTKLVYQSMVSSLDFLSATDANRKKFLVSLLGLEKYVEAEKVFKEAVKDAKNQVASIQGSVKTIEAWIGNNGKVPELKQPMPVPELEPGIERILTDRTAEASNVTLHNSVVKDNLTAIAKYNEVKNQPLEYVVDVSFDLKRFEERLKAHSTTVTELVTKKKLVEAERDKVLDIKEKCHVCHSKLEVGDKAGMLATAEAAVNDAVDAVEALRPKLSELTDLVKVTKKKQSERSLYDAYVVSLEETEAALDSSKPTEYFDLDKLAATIKQLKTDIENQKSDIKKAEKFNSEVESKNATTEYQRKQLTKFTLELNENSKKLDSAKILQARIEVLASALGNKGLIAYKIESMVKVFEDLINQYLQVLADGEFALSFAVEDTKLALTTHKGEHRVDIKSLSSGEFNRVNTATLLAVRKMMTSISKVDINLLFLDEVVSVLDEQGKDTLIEVLLKETNLNSIVVSHGYTHPLAALVMVEKENNISRLDHVI